MSKMPIVEVSVIEDDSSYSKQEKAAAAFVAIQVKSLLDVALAIAFAGGIELDIKAEGTMHGETMIQFHNKENDMPTGEH